MAKVGLTGDYLYFECPGCGRLKCFRVRGTGDDPKWDWNGSLEAPTVTPSLRSWWTEGEARVPVCCHLHVKDGKIEFCGDSTHAYAGKTVEMPEVILT